MFKERWRRGTWITGTMGTKGISKKVKIVNHPFAVRNISEKLFSINFMKYMPPTSSK